ncbi:hypothetical protein MBLNU230_g7720t1 [Neophaeotheca triangularis]
MSVPAKKGLLAQAMDRGLVELVGINEVKSLVFGTPVAGRPASLGVSGLSACTVVVVVSDLAAVVAHIGPNILGSQDPNSFTLLAQEKMSEMERLYLQDQRLFSSSTNAYVIFATFRSTPTSPEQATIFRQRLDALGLPIVRDVGYERSAQSLIDVNRAEGTVWVVKRNNTPMVYLEDQVITPNALSTQASPSESDPSQASPSQASLSQASLSQASQPQSGTGVQNADFWIGRPNGIGGMGYTQLDSSRRILQQTAAPPTSEWIHVYGQNRVYEGRRLWDGSRWYSA